MIEKYSRNAEAIYEKLYLKRDQNNKIIETIDECHMRVANYLSDDFEEYENFKRLLDEQKFRPNTPCMTNAGIKDASYHACFVLGLQDNMNSIIDMWRTVAKIYEGGGGAGIPITNLRRKDGPLSSGGYASGPLSYLRVIEEISQQVKSGGKSRRAANLVTAKYDHPDIYNIVNCKNDQESFQSMNLSISVDNHFMDSDQSISLYDPNEGYSGETVSIPELWNQICQSAWETGDPGLIFLDRINEDNPLYHIEFIECSNPCSEVVLPPNSACCLGHLNLTKYDTFTEDSDFGNDIYWAILFLNRVIEKSAYPNQKFKERMLKYRPIGLGIMGLADHFYQHGFRYGSEQSKDEFSMISQQLTKIAYQSSATLVKEEKISSIDFPDEQSINQFKEMLDKFGLSFTENEILPGNMYVTCIAPTGSCAISADCSYGFEPHFGLTWKKMLNNGSVMEFFNRDFFDALYKDSEHHGGVHPSGNLIELINKNNGSIQNIQRIPQELKDIFVVAHDIHWRDRIEMQAAGQENITMSISSTVNLPNSATVRDVSEIYRYAYEKRLKGITIYRDGCRTSQPVNFGDSKERGPMKENDFGKSYQRPMEREGKIIEVNTPAGKLYVRGSFDNGRLMEVFLDVGEQGSRENVLFNGIGRLISRALQRGVDLDDITDTLRGSGGDTFFLNLGDDRSHRVNGILDAVAAVLDEKFDIKTGQPTEGVQESAGLERCPECKKFTLRRDGSCRGGTCMFCGYSNCV